jgi:hypothetical protein
LKLLNKIESYCNTSCNFSGASLTNFETLLSLHLFWTLKISVNTKYCNSVGEFISDFPLPKLGGTCKLINICRLLWAVRRFFEVTDRSLTKTLRCLSHLFLVTIVDTTVLPANGRIAEQNQINWNHKIKQISWYRIAGPGAFTQICCTLWMVLVVRYLLKC